MRCASKPGFPGEPAKNSRGRLEAPSNRAISLRRIPIGRRYERGNLGDLETLPAELLMRHVAIIAGSGSGKTVLLRRIVEEAALRRMPAIVLDINNDLARVGDKWPSRPETWTEDDADKAARISQAC